MESPHLEIREAGKVRQVELGDEPLTIGRHRDNRVVLADSMASRFHCVISRRPTGEFRLRDLRSSNGTLLNGRLVGASDLRSGDSIRIGSAKMVFVGPNGDGAAPRFTEPATQKVARGVKEESEAEELDVPPVLDEIEEPDEVAEPLAEDDVVGDAEPSIKLDDLGAIEPPQEEELSLSEDDVVSDLEAPEPAPQLSDPTEAVEHLAESLANKPFAETDIALVSARGQLVHRAGGAPPRGKREAVDWLRLFLLLCSRSRATDIHLEPKGEHYLVRTRVDGTMVEICKLSNPMGVRFSALVKVLSELDITQKGTIQEGHFSARVPGRSRGEQRRIDYRVSFAPSVFGQKLVVRVLDTSNAPLQIADLQMPQWMQEQTVAAMKQDAGMVLVCGPTGSGKTTTLYALLRGSDVERRNVITLEDPVEIQIPGVTQIPVDESQDKTFSNLLRSTLRQDPDVILVGEIRDAETARIAMQAAITGHLVLSTLHTQNTIGTVFRLLDLGAEPYLIAQALQLVLAQRLVRQLCPFCKLPVKPTDEQVQRLGPLAEGLDRVYAARGCERCLTTGYSGRRAVFELLMTTDEVRELIAKNATAAQIQASLVSTPFQRLHQSGYELVAQGLIPFEELDRVLGRESR